MLKWFFAGLLWILAAFAAPGVDAFAQSPEGRGANAQEAPNREAPPIVYGGTALFRPFDFLDERGEPAGFNVEVVRALARVAGRRVDIRLGNWNRTLSGVKSHEIDLVMLAYTEERAKTYDYLDEFWNIRHSILFLPGRASYPTVLLDLKNETVAVSDEAVSLELLEALPDALRPTLIHAKDNATAIRLLVGGQATAVTGNALVLQTELSRLGIHHLHEVIASATSYRLATGKGRAAEMAWVGIALQKLRASGEFSALVEKHLGEPRPGTTVGERLRDAAGIGALMTIPILLVIGWNLSLRSKVASRTAEIRDANRLLELKNTELERFSYTVSHDLRSPLITIRGYLGELERSAVAGNLELFRADVSRISRAAEKMNALLRDLLALSRVGRVVKADQDVLMGEVAQDAVDLLHGVLSDRGVLVEIQPDFPLGRGDRVRLAEVLQNLIENAAKFTGGRSDARIWIGWRPGSSGPVFTVKDNGIGIDARHLEKVFNLFEKLSAEAEGTGVGLALVKRIVEAHGGRVWAESDGPNLGSTFCFTLGSTLETAPSGALVP